MAKETYYFSHDFHARNDRKIKRLLLKEKVSGVGIYWCLVEMLHEEGGYIFLSEIEVIAQELRISVQKLEKIIKNYELFKFNEDKFWSISALSRIDKKKEKSVKAKQSVSYRWEGHTNVLQSNNERTTDEQQSNNERYTIKEKEIKEKEINNKINSEGGNRPPVSPDFVNGYKYLPDGRSYIEPEFFFYKKDFGSLPKDNMDAVKIFFQSAKQITVSNDQVQSLWEVFKTNELTEQKTYRNEADVYRHFFNWSKKQSFSNRREFKSSSTKKNESVVGVSFENDFTKCKMSDGSIKDLSPNETAMAKFQGLKPSTIK